MKRLAIITTHPIQYYAPVFSLLIRQQQIDIKVFYTAGKSAATSYDHGFNKRIEWDIALLDGYAHEFVENVSAQPGSHHFKGIVTPGLTKQIEKFKPNAVLVFGWSYQGHLKAMRYFKNKIPIFFRGDSTLLDEQPGIKSLLRSIALRWVYRHVNYALYTGTNNKAYFKKFGLKESQLTFAPHAVDNQRFSEDRTKEAAALRQRLEIDPKAILILFAGKFEQKKNPMLLLDAFLKLNNDSCTLLFCGSGNLEQALKHKAGNKPSIKFIDFQNQTQMPVLYQACDLFCLPSQGPAETWGLAVNEAMTCGKAVLVSDKVGCAINLVSEGENGAVFKSNDLNSLISHLQQLTASKSKLLAYGERSKQLIAPWSFKKLAQAIEQTVNQYT